MKRMTALLLCAALICVLLTGCGSEVRSSQDLTEGIEANPVSAEGIALGGESSVAPTDFAVRLFQTGAQSGKNTLISPVSVLYALAMTANGAEGETLAQMEETLGMSVSELNDYLYAYMNSLPEAEKYKLSVANAIWFTDDERFTVEQDFLQTNADYYGAGIYQAPFDDSTLADINNWVEDNTDGMIKDVLDNIPEEAVMYLVNALAFDAEWQSIYKENQVRDAVFTKEDGTQQDIELMYSQEYSYIEDDKAAGFIKYYADSKYAFVALLPNEGVSVEEYVASLSGEHLAALLAEPQEAAVSAAIPRFECEYGVELSDILAAMGMTDAFDMYNADFTGLGHSEDENIFISRVIHKTYIAVDERGTKAGAVTAVGMSSAADTPEPKRVILDRPFVYMLIDCEANLPLFIGTMMDMA